jgi:hypothetical protein
MQNMAASGLNCLVLLSIDLKELSQSGLKVRGTGIKTG